jgi:UDP-N-acetylglucosamine 1-carboxyvinyltransferase
MADTEAYVEIMGGPRLSGEIQISGSKNACLPIMAATLLSKGTSHISNVPRLKDVYTLSDVLRSLGASVDWTGEHSLVIDTSGVYRCEPDADLVRQMRASVLVMGPLVARFGHCRLHLPGGCSLGARPIDLHLAGMQKLGAQAEENDEMVAVSLIAGDRPIGTTVHLNFPSVGATENLLMAAALADGTTIIENAAREPEIVDLAEYLLAMGATIVGAGESTITIVGSRELRSANHTVIPDRIEAGTYLAAGAMTAGRVTLRDVRADHMASTLEYLRSTGCRITTEQNRITIEAPDVIRPVDVRTMPYPGFSTDLQPLCMTLMTKACGESLFVEKIFERRFLASEELKRMGADIRVLDNCALVTGGKKLKGAEVSAPDLRAAAGLIVAGLWADGKTRIRGLQHLYRGYEHPVEKLTSLGAIISENHAVPNRCNEPSDLVSNR